MNASFKSFAIGLVLAVVLLYLILVAQFRSFLDPFIILLALPPGITGVIVALLLWGTTLNVMFLMGVVMLVGVALSNSILIVEFAHHLLLEGHTVQEAIATSCRVRLRPRFAMRRVCFRLNSIRPKGWTSSVMQALSTHSVQSTQMPQVCLWATLQSQGVTLGATPRVFLPQEPVSPLVRPPALEPRG